MLKLVTHYGQFRCELCYLFTIIQNSLLRIIWVIFSCLFRIKEKLKGYFNQDRDFTEEDYQKVCCLLLSIVIFMVIVFVVHRLQFLSAFLLLWLICLTILTLPILYMFISILPLSWTLYHQFTHTHTILSIFKLYIHKKIHVFKHFLWV